MHKKVQAERELAREGLARSLAGRPGPAGWEVGLVRPDDYLAGVLAGASLDSVEQGQAGGGRSIASRVRAAVSGRRQE